MTAIADAQAGGNGLFASAEEGFDSVYLPTGLQKIGNNAFQNNGLKRSNIPRPDFQRLETVHSRRMTLQA